MVSLLFSQAVTFSCLAIVLDRKQGCEALSLNVFLLSLLFMVFYGPVHSHIGLFTRLWAAGVRPMEFLMAHMFTQSLLLCVQTGFMLLFALAVFRLPLVGNILFAAFR